METYTSILKKYLLLPSVLWINLVKKILNKKSKQKAVLQKPETVSKLKKKLIHGITNHNFKPCR